MRTFRQFIGFFILCFCSLFAFAQGEEADFLQRRLSVAFRGETLEQALERLSAQSELSFSYDPSLIDLDAPVYESFDAQPLRFILNQLLGPEFDFRQLGKQLVIRLRDPEPAPAPAPVRTISGKITDRACDEPIPWAGLSVLGHSFGTISNKDGLFELKLPTKYAADTLVVSCVGYSRRFFPLADLHNDTLLIELKPISIRLKEIKVRAINPQWVVQQMIDHIPDNYALHTELMTAFYREVLLQDNTYINVSEAVIELLKASYLSPFSDDRIRVLKGRKSPDVEAFRWVDFKMQGGPYYTAKLDVVKTRDAFLDDKFRTDYRYLSDGMVDYLDRPAYVIRFEPVGRPDELAYAGKLYIDQESFALVHAEFSVSRSGIRAAREQLIRKKPWGFSVRALNLDYRVSYLPVNGKWVLHTAQSSVSFRVRSREDRVNSVFHSVSDLLVTGRDATRLRRFPKDEQFHSSDIFTDMIRDYDPGFWGNYNIIQPTDELQKAIRQLAAEHPDQKLQPIQP